MTSYAPDIDEPVLRLESAALATAGVGSAAVVASTVSIAIPCPFLAVTGIPCPACGMTRIARAMVHGDLGLAVSTDPAGAVVVTVLAALAVLALGAHWLTTITTGGFVDA